MTKINKRADEQFMAMSILYVNSENKLYTDADCATAATLEEVQRFFFNHGAVLKDGTYTVATAMTEAGAITCGSATYTVA